jgi:hypothetical protein
MNSPQNRIPHHMMKLSNKKLKNVDQEKGWLLLMQYKILSVTSVTVSEKQGCVRH